MGSTAALLVIDVQRVYMEPEPMVTSDGNDLIDKCNGLIGRARGAGVPVLLVQDRSDEQPDDPALVAVHSDLGARDSAPGIEKRFGSAPERRRSEPRRSSSRPDVGGRHGCAIGDAPPKGGWDRRRGWPSGCSGRTTAATCGSAS